MSNIPIDERLVSHGAGEVSGCTAMVPQAMHVCTGESMSNIPSNLVARLRAMRGHHPEIAPAIVLEAADEIERLTAELAVLQQRFDNVVDDCDRLRTLLQPIAEHLDHVGSEIPDNLKWPAIEWSRDQTLTAEEQRAADETDCAREGHQWQYVNNGPKDLSRSCVVCHKLEML